MGRPLKSLKSLMMGAVVVMLRPLWLGLGHEETQRVHVGVLHNGRLAAHVGARLADGPQHLSRYPLLEGAGLGLVAAHDELVEATFGDDEGVAHSPLRNNLIALALVFQQIPDDTGRGITLVGFVPAKLKCPANVSRHKPRLAFDSDYASASWRLRMLLELKLRKARLCGA